MMHSVKLVVLLAFCSIVLLDSVSCAIAKKNWLDDFFNFFFNRKCDYQGVRYNKGDIIDYNYDAVTDVCTVIRCNKNSEVVTQTVSNCVHSDARTQPNTPPSTRRPITTPTSTPRGCLHNGQYYPLSSTISENQYGGWCTVIYCDSNGEIIYGDNFDCTSSVSTTRSTTRRPTTPPPGCYENGKWYAPGDMISEGRSGNWCYFSMCTKDGVVHGDDFNCTPSPPTTRRPTSSATSSPTPDDTDKRVLLRRLYDLLKPKKSI